MGPNRSGMPPEHSQTRLGHFWKKSFFVKNLEKRPKSHETSMGRKTVFFLRNHKNKNDVHRHDSNFGGRMAFPSSIWSPFVKKRVLAKSMNSPLKGIGVRDFYAFFDFFCYDFSEKNGFPAHGRFMIFRTFSGIFNEKWVFPKMTQKCLGLLGGHPWPIRTHIWPILTKIA